MSELITRQKRFDGKKYWLTSNTQEISGGRWTNCLYLHFVKDEFPLIKSPPLVDCDWGNIKRRFSYSQSILNEPDWHGGITFYEETMSLESGFTYVKVGCDYSHLYDDAYMSGDHGKEILERDGDRIVREFEELYLRLQKESAQEVQQ